jgi:hypothetical protein
MTEDEIISEEIRLIERIECAKAVKAEGDDYMAAGEKAKDDGRLDDAAEFYAGAGALYKMAEMLARRSMA